MRLVITYLAILALLFSSMALIVYEHFFWLIVVSNGIVFTWLFLIFYISNNKLKQKAAKEGALDAFICKHIDGLGLGKTKCELRNYPDRLEIREVRNNRKYYIPHERIRSLEVQQVRRPETSCLCVNYIDKHGWMEKIVFENRLNLIRMRTFARGVNASLTPTYERTTIHF